MSRASRKAFPLLVGALGAVTSLLVAGAAPPTSASAAANSAAANSSAASAAPTQVAVIPPDPAQRLIGDELVMAGTTGFLHKYNFVGQYLWTDYATGQTVTVPTSAALGTGLDMTAGGDNVAAVNGRVITETDLAAGMTTQQWTLPTGYVAVGVSGNSVLAATKSGTTVAWELVTFAADGSDTITAVTGLPAGALYAGRTTIGDAAAIAVDWRLNNVLQYGLLNVATATVTPIPVTPGFLVALLADRIAFYDSTTKTVSVYSRAGLLDGTDTTATTVTLPTAATQVALVGDHVIALSGTAPCGSYCTEPALDFPLSGGAAGQVLLQAQTDGLVQAPGGAAVIVGGTGPGDWSVRRLTVDANDQVTDTAVLPLTAMSNGGLTISQALVRHIQVQQGPGAVPSYQLFDHLLVPPGASSPAPAVYGGALSSSLLPCAAGAACVRTVDGNDYGTSLLTAYSATTINLMNLPGDAGWVSMNLPSAGGSVVDASSEYVIIDGTSPANQYLVEPAYGRIVSTGPVTGAGLWFDTLWRSDGAGQLQATNLTTNTAAKPIATGANCVASDVQATQRWVYWSCGTNGPAGVYDQGTHTEIPLPSTATGPMLLGDGYVVRHDSTTGDLVMYDVHADSVAAPVTLATAVPNGPTTDDRNITWAVDKYSGDVAYVAADNSVHVLDTGVPATPLAVTSMWNSMNPPSIYFETNGAWSLGLALSRPVTSSTMTIRAAGTTHVVHTQSFGFTPAESGGSWDGYLPSGAKAYSGRYTWTVTATVAGSTATYTLGSGPVTVECGQIPYRSYDCDGASALLVDVGGTLGDSHWYEGIAFNGGLHDNGYTDNWPLCSYSTCVSTIVPFGDINGDGYADILVKYRSGKLVAYLGIGQAYFNPNGGIRSVSLGTSWNTYNALAYPGDLNGDGKPDLIARDTLGRLWLFAGNGKGGFKSRVQISGSWGGYSKLVGAGDLTGDGVGDLLAIDKSGVMWLLAGNGKGGFKGRVLVSSGWSKYNAVIGVGDLSVDGCNDLIARDTLGNLYRINGNCKGGFSAPKKLGSGWGKYQGLF